MASILMSIKARMMLPVERSEDEELDEEDPRYELVQKLLEYKQYKEMAEKMTVIDDEARKKYFRGYPEADEIDTQASGEALNEVTLYDLISAFRKVLTDIQRQAVYHKVEKVSYTVEIGRASCRERIVGR